MADLIHYPSVIGTALAYTLGMAWNAGISETINDLCPKCPKISRWINILLVTVLVFAAVYVLNAASRTVRGVPFFVRPIVENRVSFR